MSRLRVSENGEKVKIRTTNDCTLLWHVGCGCMWGVGVIVSVYTPHTHTHTPKSLAPCSWPWVRARPVIADRVPHDGLSQVLSPNAPTPVSKREGLSCMVHHNALH